jgi:hypothetical protein
MCAVSLSGLTPFENRKVVAPFLFVFMKSSEPVHNRMGRFLEDCECNERAYSPYRSLYENYRINASFPE